MPRIINPFGEGRSRRRSPDLDPPAAGAGGDLPAGLVVLPPGWRIARATTPGQRLRGLLGRRTLEAGEGLWLPVRSVHTLGMRFALDLVWLAGDGSVVRIDSDVGPGRVRTCVAARGVVELRVGDGCALAEALAAVSPGPTG